MPARLFRFSTQTGDSVTNAAKALDAPISFEDASVQAALAGAGLSPVPSGWAWSFKSGMSITNPSKAMAPGDVAIRITKDGAGTRVIESFYEVLGYFPNNEELISSGIGITWNGTGPWPNSTLFGSRYVLPTAVLYDPLAVTYSWPEGAMLPATWLDTAGPLEEWLARELLVSVPVSPSGLTIKKKKPPLTGPDRPTRPSNAAFKAAVTRAYSIAGVLCCGACDLTESALIDAAHIVDYGYADEEWFNGLPLCPTHHRAFDIGRIKLNPTSTTWEAGPALTTGLTSVGVTRPDITHLPKKPNADALTWKY